MPRVEEHPIGSERFAQALREQRAMRLKGGLYHLNQVLMAYNTNRIEGSLLDEDQTCCIYETRTVTGDAVRVDDVVETMNSCELFDVMIDSHDATITAEPLKNYHRLLKAGTAHARAE